METENKQSKAKNGDKIMILKGEYKGEGKVLEIRENSVIVELGINTRTGEPMKTVVNHKNYKVI